VCVCVCVCVCARVSLLTLSMTPHLVNSRYVCFASRSGVYAAGVAPILILQDWRCIHEDAFLESCQVANRCSMRVSNWQASCRMMLQTCQKKQRTSPCSSLDLNQDACIRVLLALLLGLNLLHYCINPLSRHKRELLTSPTHMDVPVLA
jgi:hypothetical protein